jgi:hypothetical protein
LDLEAAAAAQRWRPGREPLLKAGKQLVVVRVQGDDGPGTLISTLRLRSDQSASHRRDAKRALGGPTVQECPGGPLGAVR